MSDAWKPRVEVACPRGAHAVARLADARLPPDVEVGVYRIAQELLTNVLKHAQARNVQVQLLRNKGHLVLIIEDEGVGFDQGRASNGMGMRNLHDRARVLRGTLDIVPGVDRGTIATLRVPLNNGNTA